MTETGRAARAQEDPIVRSVRDLVMDAREKIEMVSPGDARAELEAGEAVAIDVREPVEWEHHIEGAYQIPRGLLEFVSDPECGPRLPPSLKYDRTSPANDRIPLSPARTWGVNFMFRRVPPVST